MIRVLLFSGLVLAAGFAPLTTDGKASGLSAKQLATLRKSKFKVVVPTYVPAGFKVDSVGFTDTKVPVEASFALTYKNAKTKAEFTVQMASDGLGDPIFTLDNGDAVDATSVLKAKSPILGAVDVEVYAKGREKMFQCTWMEHKNRSLPQFAMAYGRGVDGATGKKIIESLRWLK
ncbi:MAG: hypothetical protein BGO01_12570 [Armatimonadetes bacterium 55-13]|nr:hypothetical protein [Armatimonadota bacterium]ODU52253.1 MAG: hypothetical protein ABT09_02860 [bacterium SCN 57-13]OJU61746.1 MAG: hypothetical protein BGO01_12570 [Armatimonadetes bacterium 55-13]